MKDRYRIKFFFATIIIIFIPFSQVKADCVAVIPAGWQHVFWRQVVQGVRQAAKDHHVAFKYRAPTQEGRVIAQKRIIEEFRKEGCHAFVIAPVDISINEDVAALKKLGIPSVYVDRGTDGQDQARAIIATDNYMAGRRAAQQLIKRIGRDGTVAILRMHKGVISTTAREKGFVEAAEEAGLKIELDTYLGLTTGDAMRTSRRIISRLRKVDGIFTPNESTTQGVLISLSQNPNLPRPIHIGFDFNENIAQAIDNGFLYATIVQDPYQMGYQGVELVTQDHEILPKQRKIMIPISIVTKEKLSEFRSTSDHK